MRVSRTSRRGQLEQSENDALFARANRQWEQGKLRSAYSLLLLGAKRGDASAQHNLGYFYDVGLGVRPNRAKALHWYKLAYRRGSRVAASNIASIHKDEGDNASALAWYQRAARLHDGDANLEIAKLLIASNKMNSALKYLKRAFGGSARDVTQSAREEARRLLVRVTRKVNLVHPRKKLQREGRRAEREGRRAVGS